MPLSKQEQHCVDLTCRFLGDHYQGSWSIQQYLDDLYPSEPTPEVIVSNGEKTAAVEVKRLTGDSTHQDYVASLLSNNKFLVPSCGGSYHLNPPVDFRLPMPADQRRLVKREIERVAPTLRSDQKSGIRIPRQAHVSLISETVPSFIYCLHGWQYADLNGCLEEKAPGQFMLIDEGLEHSFVTQECKAAFEQAVVIACKQRLEGKTGPFSWYEEWELARIDHDGPERGQDGVWMAVATEARSMPESVEQGVHAVLGKAMEKFGKRRWADLQIIALDTSVIAPASLAAPAVETFESGDKDRIDHFLLVDGEDVTDAGDLVAALSSAVEAREHRRRQRIIDAPISEDRVERFEESYLKGRQDIGATEKIFRHFRAFQQRKERNEIASFGFDTLIHKGSFVDDSSWAVPRGWEFAVGEERRLLGDLQHILAESVSQTGQTLSEDISRKSTRILQAATGMSELLAENGYYQRLVVVATHLDTDTLVDFQQMLDTPGWDLNDDLRTNWILGKHDSCLVLYMNDPELNNLYVVDVSRFAKLTQYHPLVDLNILDIDEARAKQMLEERPDLGMDMNALRRMAHLTLYQSYEFEICDRHAVWAARFSPRVIR